MNRNQWIVVIVVAIVFAGGGYYFGKQSAAALRPRPLALMQAAPGQQDMQGVRRVPAALPGQEEARRRNDRSDRQRQLYDPTPDLYLYYSDDRYQDRTF